MDRKNRGSPPDYSVEALNTMALLIAQKLETSGLHGMVYARQYWSELVDAFPNPNSIVVSVLNPFSSFRNNSCGDIVFGDIVSFPKGGEVGKGGKKKEKDA